MCLTQVLVFHFAGSAIYNSFIYGDYDHVYVGCVHMRSKYLYNDNGKMENLTQREGKLSDGKVMLQVMLHGTSSVQYIAD